VIGTGGELGDIASPYLGRIARVTEPAVLGARLSLHLPAANLRFRVRIYTNDTQVSSIKYIRQKLHQDTRHDSTSDSGGIRAGHPHPHDRVPRSSEPSVATIIGLFSQSHVRDPSGTSILHPTRPRFFLYTTTALYPLPSCSLLLVRHLKRDRGDCLDWVRSYRRRVAAC